MKKEAKDAIESLKEEVNIADSELRKLVKESRIINTRRNELDQIKRDLLKQIKHLESIIESENIFETVNHIDGFDTLLQEELLVISDGNE